MAKYVVANASEITPGQRKIVEIEGRNVGVFNVDGKYYALLDRCPHAGARLCSFGSISGSAEAEAPDTAISYKPGVFLKCPWHQWEFSLDTGQSYFDSGSMRVRKYNVDVIEGAPEEFYDPSQEGLQEGPYVLEGFAVDIEDSMVVIDTSRRRKQRSRAVIASTAEGGKQ
jgi:nitrite reductase/ring-hydroxylating ferredoxin subunit